MNEMLNIHTRTNQVNVDLVFRTFLFEIDFVFHEIDLTLTFFFTVEKFIHRRKTCE